MSEIRLDKITTKTGDNGKALSNCGFKNKSHKWFDLIGCLDELNAIIGLAQQNASVDTELIITIQHSLFDIGGDLYSNTEKVDQVYLSYLESACEKYSPEPVNSFVLPVGNTSYWHLARAITRRTERAFWDVYEEGGEDGKVINLFVGKYLNRLSDLFYMLSRSKHLLNNNCNILWKPGILKP